MAKKPSDRMPRVSLRLSAEELAELQRRARGSGAASLNRYLIERGLASNASGMAEGATPSGQGQGELWERAVFEIRKVSHSLRVLSARVGSSKEGRQASLGSTANLKMERALAETRAAVAAIAEALKRGED